LTGVRTASPERRLPPGRHGLSRELVRESQRRRLMSAAAKTLAEQGYDAITVTAVAKAAGISTGTLYKRFDGLWGCLLAAYEAGADRLCREIELAGAAAADRREAGAAAIANGLALLGSEPALANLLFTPPPTHAVALGAARLCLAERLATLLHSTRRDGSAGDGRELPLIAGTMSLVARQLRNGEQLPDLGPTLTEILLPLRPETTREA
jgi:AcrR family transcriptional regulator